MYPLMNVDRNQRSAPGIMTSQVKPSRQSRTRRSPPAKIQSHGCDSESETAVTSTSGQKVALVVPKPVKRKSRSQPESVSQSKSELVQKSSSASVQAMKRQRLTDTKSGSIRRAIVAAPEKSDVKPDMSDATSGKQRLLMREWLIKEVSQGDIPGLKWLDPPCQTLLCIPWIHASKEGWSKDHHCKLFESWAVYTGKYDPKRDKADPKRWKANFRCALNSLPDVKEMSQLGKKNGRDGFKVYQLETPNPRKGHKKMKCRPLTSSGHDSNSPDQDNLPPSKPSSAVSTITAASAVSFNHRDGLTDSSGNLLFQPHETNVLQLPFVSACSTEFISDTVTSGDGCYTSLSSVDVIVIAPDNQQQGDGVRETEEEWGSSTGGNIVLLRNMDHNYFKAQIPTTVENFMDDDNSFSHKREPPAKKPKNTS